MEVLKIKDNLRRFGIKSTLTGLLGFVLSLATQNSVKAQTAMFGFGMGQNFSTQEWYYRGSINVFANESMWGIYQAFEFRPPSTDLATHFKLPTGLYARLRGPLYVHYGLDAGTSLAFGEPLRHDVGLSLRFKGLQLITNYAGRNGWSAQLSVPIK